VVHVLLKGSDLCLQVKDPQEVVASLKLQLEPPGTKPVAVLLSLKERETLLLVGRRETVKGQPSRLQTLAHHQLSGVAQCLKCEHGIQAMCQCPCDVQWNSK
jgi:hypothetical protein